MAGGVAVKALAAKAGVAAALAVGAAGGGVAVEHAVHEPPARGTAAEQAARRVPAERRRRRRFRALPFRAAGTAAARRRGSARGPRCGWLDGRGGRC